MNKYTAEQLFAEYHQDIYHYLIYILGEYAIEAEDLLQEVFIRVIKKIDSFNGESSPKTWVTAIARNCAYDFLRKKRFSFSKQTSNEYFNIVSPENPEKEIIQKEEFNELIKLLSSIKSKYREVLYFRVYLDVNTKESAALMGCSEQRIRVLLHRAKKQVKEVVENNPIFERSDSRWKKIEG